MKSALFHRLRNLDRALAWAGALALPAAMAADPEPAADASQASAPAYLIENVTLPHGFDPGIGALAFNEAGELVVVSRRTGIIAGLPAPEPGAFAWRTVCDQSLHNPLGVLVEAGGSLLVPQMPELTRLYDTDEDGVADYFETVSTAWGLSGNYHETNCGPLPDGEGNWFVALGTASHAGPTFAKIRGDYSPAGRRGRNFSAAPYKGWIVKITPSGELVPWASGFRQCNGLGMNAAGELFATDNQGDWKPTTPIYHIEEGNFYGHPASLAWDPEFIAEYPDPLAWAVDNLAAIDQMRTRPAVQLPHGTICNSASEPLFDDSGGAFGPFAGQMFVGDIAGQRILRVMLEKVDGHYQGAVTHFIDSASLGGGNNRLCFSPAGSQLYVGQTYRGWGKPAEGLKRITWTGRTPYALQNISLVTNGFELTFTEAVDREIATAPANYAVKHFTYQYSQKYGSPPIEETNVTPKRIIVTPDGRGVTLQFDELVTDRIYEIDLSGIASGSGAQVEHGVLCYTLNRLRPPTQATIQFKPSKEAEFEPKVDEKAGTEPEKQTEPEPEPKESGEKKVEPGLSGASPKAG